MRTEYKFKTKNCYDELYECEIHTDSENLWTEITDAIKEAGDRGARRVDVEFGRPTDGKQNAEVQFWASRLTQVKYYNDESVERPKEKPVSNQTSFFDAK